MPDALLHDGLADRVYEIDSSGEVLQVTPLAPRARGRSRRERCHTIFWTRSTPCLNCPFFADPRLSDDRLRSGIIGTAASGCAVLVVGRRIAIDRIRVAQYQLEGVLFEQFLASRIDALSSDSKLSAREREVLHLILLGRSLGEIALALTISVRTAKYHQANVLAKLGADSRHDLLRIITGAEKQERGPR